MHIALKNAFLSLELKHFRNRHKKAHIEHISYKISLHESNEILNILYFFRFNC